MSNDKGISRRDFLERAAKAGLSVAAASAGAAYFFDKNPPPAQPPSELVTLGDYSVRGVPGRSLAMVTSADRTAGINKAMDLLGGMDRFVKSGERVFIKPNVAFASSPSIGATTSPELVGRLVRMCYDAGARQVVVADNPINDPQSCFTFSGIGKAATEAGATVIMPKESLFRPTTLAGGRLIRQWPLFFGPFEKIDKLIGVAPIKDHARSHASMSMKNWYGLLGGRRNLFHQDINGIISELAMLVKPTLVVLDGTMVMMRNGPTGGSVMDLEKRDTIIVSTDQVAADSLGSTLLGLTPEKLPFLQLAEAAGVGTRDYLSLKPLIARID